jgi:Tol biopolymer transport system component
MGVPFAGARALLCASAASVLAACGGSSSTDGPNGPPGLTNTIVFVSDRTGADELYVMRGDGNSAQLLATLPGPKTDPVISPDGKKIAFTLGSVTFGNISPLWIVNSDGTGLKQLTTDYANDFRPCWSPDGSKIAFASTRDGNAEIYVMRADGTHQTNITNNNAFDSSPAWSPSGNTILFESDRDSVVDLKIWSMTPTGDSVTPLVAGYNPEWSPSGTRFLFLRGAEIWIAETTDGSVVHQVTFEEDSYFHFTPGWSPDESRLVYTTATSLSSPEEIWTVSSADGSDVVQLTPDSAHDNYTPSWTRH